MHMDATQTAQTDTETVTLKIFQSGYAVDGRGITPIYARHLAESTAYYQQSRNWQVPCHPSHPEPCSDMPAQEIEGHVGNFRWEANEAGEGDVVADVTMRGELLSNYKAGKYLGWSVGIADTEMTAADGRKLGPVIAHLAMLGRDNPAFPDLSKTAAEFAAKTRNPSLLRRIVSAVKPLVFAIDKRLGTHFAAMFAAEPTEKDGFAMPEWYEKIKGGLEMAMEGLAECEAEMGAGEPAEGEEVVVEAEGEGEYKGKRKPIAKHSANPDSALVARIADLEAERVRNVFAANGFPESVRERFDKSVTAIGLEETVELFQSLNFPKPPKDPKGAFAGGTVDGLSDAERKDKQRFDYFTLMKLPIDAKLQELATAKGWTK